MRLCLLKLREEREYCHQRNTGSKERIKISIISYFYIIALTRRLIIVLSNLTYVRFTHKFLKSKMGDWGWGVEEKRGTWAQAQHGGIICVLQTQFSSFFFKQTLTDMTRLCIRFSYKHLTDRTLLCFDELSQ